MDDSLNVVQHEFASSMVLTAGSASPWTRKGCLFRSMEPHEVGAASYARMIENHREALSQQHWLESLSMLSEHARRLWTEAMPIYRHIIYFQKALSIYGSQAAMVAGKSC